MNNSYKNKNINNSKVEICNWHAVQTEMKNKLGLDVYESWLKKINLIDEFNNYILLSVPTRFIRDWITSRYLDQILQVIKQYKKGIIRERHVGVLTTKIWKEKFERFLNNDNDV